MNALNIIQERGFGVLPEVLLPHEARRLIDDLDQSPLRRSKAGVRHALRHPSVAALAREPRLLNIAREVLGAVKDGVVYAHAPASVLRQVLALRIHLDDSTSHNGPLRVLPGTHTE